MEMTIAELEAYLSDHYKNGTTDQGLFMKLVEETGEVAEVLNKKAGRKKSDSEDLQTQLGNELAKIASVKYNHTTNLKQFMTDRRDGKSDC